MWRGVTKPNPFQMLEDPVAIARAEPLRRYAPSQPDQGVTVLLGQLVQTLVQIFQPSADARLLRRERARDPTQAYRFAEPCRQIAHRVDRPPRVVAPKLAVTPIKATGEGNSGMEQRRLCGIERSSRSLTKSTGTR